MRRLTPLILLCAATALIAGCGSDSETKTVTETVTETGSTPAADTTATETDAAEAPLTDSGLKLRDGFVQFQSPSKNIGCGAAGDEVRCDIFKKTFTSPPKPASCDLDWGDSIVLGGGVKSQFLCHGDTAAGAGPVLPYGTYVKYGEFRCESRKIGITCRNGTGQGFFLSRGAYRLTP